MDDPRRNILLHVLDQHLAVLPTIKAADAVVVEIVSDDMTAWYQQFRRRAGDSDRLYMALLAEHDRRSDVLLSGARTVLSLSRTGLVDHAALAESISMLATILDEIDAQWDALEHTTMQPTVVGIAEPGGTK